ncbi:MAG TPA: twin-arginine translocation signal domain-containing protein, partial [Chitinophagaceae bacterium]|nr:twin-arginine translocation signal domain-containing protein [Chitinophagaceae bacterium]
MDNNNNKPVKSQSMDHQKSRRAFIKNSAGLTALAAAGPLAGLSPLNAFAAARPAEEMSHGIQIGAVSFVDEGVEKVLDIMEKRGAINTLYLTTFTHGR